MGSSELAWLELQYKAAREDCQRSTDHTPEWLRIRRAMRLLTLMDRVKELGGDLNDRMDYTP